MISLLHSSNSEGFCDFGMTLIETTDRGIVFLSFFLLDLG